MKVIIGKIAYAIIVIIIQMQFSKDAQKHDISPTGMNITMLFFFGLYFLLSTLPYMENITYLLFVITTIVTIITEFAMIDDIITERNDKLR